MLTGDPVRALAVLVVATPCPLILAVPVAIVAGICRAARARRPGQGRRRARGAGPGPHRAVRQDRHADRRAGRASSPSTPTRRLTGTRSCAWPPRSTRRSTHPVAAALVAAARGARARPAVAGRRVAKIPATGVAGRVEGRRGASLGGRRVLVRRHRARTAAAPPVGRRSPPGSVAWRSRSTGALRRPLVLADGLREEAPRAAAPAARARHRADRAGHRRPRATWRSRSRAPAASTWCSRELIADREDRGGARRSAARPGDDGRRRRQRRAGARRRRRRRRHGRARHRGLGRGGRRGAAGRPPRPARRGDGDRPALPRHRAAERAGGHRPVGAAA